MRSALSLFRVVRTQLRMFMKTNVTKIVQQKVLEHILLNCVQYTYMQ